MKVKINVNTMLNVIVDTNIIKTTIRTINNDTTTITTIVVVVILEEEGVIGEEEEEDRE